MSATHHQPDLLQIRVRGCDRAHDTAGTQHGDPITQSQQLVEVGRDEQDGSPAARSSSSCARTYSVAPTSSPAVGLAAMISRGAREDSRARTRRWRLPPESCLASVRVLGACTLVLRQQPAHMRVDVAHPEDAVRAPGAGHDATSRWCCASGPGPGTRRSDEPCPEYRRLRDQ